MNPIMRKSGLTPDQLMRRQLYSLLKPRAQDDGINILGNCFLTDETSELVKIIRQTGRPLRDITVCKTYEDYQKWPRRRFTSFLQSPRKGGRRGALEPARRNVFVSVPEPYGKNHPEEPANALRGARNKLDLSEDEARAEAALLHAKKLLGETEIAIDYTATPAPMSLARCLLEHGFRVTRIYADSIAADDQEDFRWLQEHAPDIELYATVQVKLRVLARETEKPTLAIGQKAAYFTGTKHFVNIVEGGGMYGFRRASPLGGADGGSVQNRTGRARFYPAKRIEGVTAAYETDASLSLNHTADASGVCSALFELGGMTVMHDASGCNSTYNTHDEPRWYDMDSLVYISGLSELEAVMGDDEKLISDVSDAARQLHPRFIALAGTPIPMITGCDLPAIAREVEGRTKFRPSPCRVMASGPTLRARGRRCGSMRSDSSQAGPEKRKKHRQYFRCDAAGFFR